MQLHEKPLAHELAQPNVYRLASLPGWPQIRGEGWFWVALGLPTLLV